MPAGIYDCSFARREKISLGIYVRSIIPLSRFVRGNQFLAALKGGKKRSARSLSRPLARCMMSYFFSPLARSLNANPLSIRPSEYPAEIASSELDRYA